MKVLVTGAFGFTGRHVTKRLLAAGHSVRTFTRNPVDAFDGAVEAVNPTWSIAGLREHLDVDAIVNTTWARFGAKGDFQPLVERNRGLFTAAKQAGVERIVHVSVLCADSNSRFPYYAGKGRTEEALGMSGIDHSILRPAMIYGDDDTLLNNTAWMIRKFPSMPVPDGGFARVRPTNVEDLAELAVKELTNTGNHTIDAVGPNTYKWVELLTLLRDKMHVKCKFPSVKPFTALLGTKLLNPFLRDIILTRDELFAMQEGLLATDAETTCPTDLDAWLDEHAGGLGLEYRSQKVRAGQ